MSRVVKLFIALALILCPAYASMAQELDSLTQKALSEKLGEYYLAMEREGTDVQKQECDFLIDAATDSLVRQYVALDIYDHYMNSPVMGSEAVAIHVLDKWFVTGRVKMKTEIDLINARVFADFNRQSLVGLPSPSITMSDMDGKEMTLFGEGSGPMKYFSILFFYDTDCAKCKIESILMRNLLEDRNYPVEFFAIYSDDSESAWREYVETQLNIDASEVNVTHLWDPELDSDFQRKYGVIKTPCIFLVRPDGMIIGRGLDSKGLFSMLDDIFRHDDLNYGTPESVSLFDNVLADDSGVIEPSVEKVTRLADYIKSSTLSKGDENMFRQLTGDMLYYLASRSGEGFREGLHYLIENNITAFPEVWNSPDDSLKVVGFAQIMDDLLSKAEPGKPVPAFKLPAERVAKGKSRTGTFKLNKLKGERNIIMFNTEGCEICKAEKAAIRQMTSQDRNLHVLFINVDEIMREMPSVSGSLFDSFDLSALPYILEADRKGMVIRRYLSYR